MKSRPHILLIEDDTELANSLQRVLAQEGYRVTWKARGDSGLAQAEQENFTAVLCDFKLPGTDGLKVLRGLRAAKPSLPIIFITAHGTTDTAIEATKSGAFEYLLKPFEMGELLELLARAIAVQATPSDSLEVPSKGISGNLMIGNSRVMQNLYKEVGRIAAKPVDVLIRGETGTGKELIARAIVQHSQRVEAPFVVVNCAAIPETLLESELFGHERGAFTGAESRRIGRFEQARGGTIFLDEIGDIPLGIQAKLLRVVQEKCFQRLAGKENISVEARILAATNRDLEAAIREKEFRDDLYYRLSTVVLTVPALRERLEDIPDLVTYFLQKHGQEMGDPTPSINPEAINLLQSQSWPGNVRELENTLRKALLLARGFSIDAQHIRAALAATDLPGPPESQSLGDFAGHLLSAARCGDVTEVHKRFLETAERELLRQAIQLAQGNQAKVARWLGISRLTLRERLTRYGLHPAQGRNGDPTQSNDSGD